MAKWEISELGLVMYLWTVLTVLLALMEAALPSEIRGGPSLALGRHPDRVYGVDLGLDLDPDSDCLSPD